MIIANGGHLLHMLLHGKFTVQMDAEIADTTTVVTLAAQPIGQGGLVLMGKPYYLPCHFLLLRNKNKSTASVSAT